MAKQILIPLRMRDRIEEVIPYVEEFAEHGTRMLFLVHSGKNRFERLLAHLTEMETGNRGMLESQEIADRESLQKQRDSAERALLAAFGSLRGAGVNVSAILYRGSLRKAVRAHCRNGQIDLIMMPAEKRAVITQAWVRLAAGFKRVNLSEHPAVLLVRPSEFV